jgi:hypothetical protein
VNLLDVEGAVCDVVRRLIFQVTGGMARSLHPNDPLVFHDDASQTP